ncbi:MAG: 30S ribosomal protein S20 [Flavobacteriales bacterium]|nr:30S ribosomal protein S20 [Flavobacteriales bacterium]
MANHKSSIKRIRSNDVKRDRNKYYHKTMRNALRKLRSSNSKAEVEKIAPSVISLLDKLGKNSVIHKNKVGNLKSSIARRISHLS